MSDARRRGRARPSEKRERLLGLQRPHCPDCNMRMIATGRDVDKSRDRTFECLRCGYAGPALQREAAE
jgi:tRNA(Ile2) C34 agmatinyltransferase TiaS